MISQKSVQEILDTAKVEDVVQEYVTLKRRGVNMLGLCPFHNEKTLPLPFLRPRTSISALAVGREVMLFSF